MSDAANIPATTPIIDPAMRALAVATDIRLAELDGEYARLEARIAAAISTVRHLLGQRSRWITHTRQEWPTTADQAVELLRTRVGQATSAHTDSSMKPWAIHDARKTLRRLDEQRRTALVNRADAAELHQVWADNGHWSRFFLVKASNGHVHHDISGSRCSRNPLTEHGWNPDLSGLTEAEAVAALGPRLCTLCFPAAPVEWTVGKIGPARCGGSGKAPVPNTSKRHGMKTYGECTECGKRQILTLSHDIRAHKPELMKEGTR